MQTNSPTSLFIGDEDLEKAIIDHSINYWKYLNINRLADAKQAKNFFIQDELVKINFVNEIETLTFDFCDKNILDIGCGKGSIVLCCASKGARATGIDIDREELDIARKRAKSMNLDCKFQVGDGSDICYPDEIFDIVIATGVLEHVNDHKKVVKEMMRVTKKGGYCCIVTPNARFPREGHYKSFIVPYTPKKIVGKYLKIRGYNPDFFIRYVHYPYPSYSSICKALNENGAVVTNNTEEGIIKKINMPSSIRNRRLKAIISLANKFNLKPLMIGFVKTFHPYKTYILISRKV